MRGPLEALSAMRAADTAVREAKALCAKAAGAIMQYSKCEQGLVNEYHDRACICSALVTGGWGGTRIARVARADGVSCRSAI